MFNVGIMVTVLSPYLAVIPGVLILYRIIKNQYTVELNPLNTGLIILFIISLFSGIVNGSLYSTLASFALLLFFAVSVYLQNKLTDKKQFEHFIEKVWKVSLVAGLIGIVEKIASYFIDMTWTSELFFKGPYIPSVENYRIYSTLGNPNVAGGWFAVMVLIGIYLFEREKGKQKLFAFLSIVIFIFCLIFTGSKGATLGLELGILVYALSLRDSKSRKMMLVIFSTILVLALLSPEINHPLGSRDGIWQQSIQLFINKPILGNGVFGVWESITKTHSHNIWLSFLTMFGISGFITYIWMKLYIFRGLLSLYKNQSKLLPLLASIQASIIGHGLVDFIIMTPQGGMMFIACSALIASMSNSYFRYPAFEHRNIRVATKKML